MKIRLFLFSSSFFLAHIDYNNVKEAVDSFAVVLVDSRVLCIHCGFKMLKGNRNENVTLKAPIIIMEICNAPTLRLIAPNKHSVTHMMYIEMEMLSAMKMHIRKKKRKRKRKQNKTNT